MNILTKNKENSQEKELTKFGNLFVTIVVNVIVILLLVVMPILCALHLYFDFHF